MYDPNGEFGILTTLAIIGVCAIVGSALGAFNAACTGGDPVEGAVEGFLTGALGAAAGLYFSAGVAFALGCAGGTVVDVVVQLISQYAENKNIDISALDFSRSFKVGIQTGVGAAIPAVGDLGISNAISTSVIWCEVSAIISCLDVGFSNYISLKHKKIDKLEEISWSLS